MRMSWLVVMVMMAVSCGPKGAFHDPCTVAGDCTGGLSCIPSLVQSGSTCGPKGSTCNKTCTTKADCASIGATADCATDCSGAKVCIKL